MATQEQLLQALENADRAFENGNKEAAGDAKELARMINDGEYENKINKVAEGARKFAKGASFGFSDEIEAALRADDQLSKFGLAAGLNQNQNANLGMASGLEFQGDTQKYRQIKNQLGAQEKEFEKQNPKTALGLEILGGVALPFGVAGKAATTGGKVASGALQGAGYGALYGAGTADEMKDVGINTLTQGALGGLLGGGISKIGQVAAPRVSALTNKMMSRGNDLTPGQMFGGLTNTLEQKFGSVIPGIKTARNRATAQWNKEIADDVLRPLGKKLPSSITTNSEASQYITKVVDDAYTEAYKGMKVNATPELKASLKSIVSESGLQGTAKRKLQSEINSIISMIENKSTIGYGKNRKKIAQGIFDKNVKNVDKNIKTKIDAFRKSTNINESPLEAPLRNARDIFKNNVVLQNPIQGKKLLDTDLAYGKVASFQKAVGAGNKSGVFSPDQLSRSAIEGQTAASKRISKANQSGQLQKSAKEAEQVLGDYVPDSGTAGNLAVNSIVAGLIDPYVLGGYITAEVAYSKPMIALINKYVRSGGNREGFRQFMEKYAGTATSGLLNTQQ